MEDLFNEANIPKSNWFKFEKVGQIVQGTLVEKNIKPASNPFPEQTVYVLTNASAGTATIVDGKPTKPVLEEVGDINVASSKEFVNSRLKAVTKGDIIGFAFIEEIKSKKAGFAPAKSIIPFVSATKDQDYLDSLGLNVEIADDVFE